jgi:hypothetical protein
LEGAIVAAPIGLLTGDDDDRPARKIRNCGQMVRSNMNFVGSLPFRGE